MATWSNKVDLRLVEPQQDGAAKTPSWRGPALPPQTGDYYQRIESYAHRIRSTPDVAEIIGILDEALNETRLLHVVAELELAHEKVDRAEREIEALKSELQQVIELVHVDPLTGTLNRRGLDDAFGREAARCDRHRAPLCLAVLDVDNFKKINDTHGHQVGDAVLAHLARTINTTLRPNDVIARFGGEEFAVLLPDTDEEAAFFAISRLLDALSRQPFSTGGASIPVTFSAGVARRQTAESQASLMARADTALYRAKHAGKNQVLIEAS